MLNCGRTRWQRFITSIPGLNTYTEFILFVDDSTNLEKGQQIEADVKPVWRGYNVYSSEKCGKPDSIEILSKRTQGDSEMNNNMNEQLTEDDIFKLVNPSTLAEKKALNQAFAEVGTEPSDLIQYLDKQHNLSFSCRAKLKTRLARIESIDERGNN